MHRNPKIDRIAKSGPRKLASHPIALLVASVSLLVGCAGQVATAAPARVTPAASLPVGPTPASTFRTAVTASPDQAECSPVPLPFDRKNIDLTGAWAGDDGGIFYVQQNGNIIWWNELSGQAGPAADEGRGFDNVGRGVIGADLKITAQWSEVPRGGSYGGGPVDYQIGPDVHGDIQITKTYDPGHGRDDTTWTRCQAGYF
jgi:hypothetical protein